MKILRLEITNLYGSLTRSIDFYAELNLLVGINGSGKTSVLNCIDWVLRPDLARLATTPFDAIRLTCSHENKTYELLARQDSSGLTLSEETGVLACRPISVKFLKHPQSFASDQESLELVRMYRRLGPETHEKKLWQFLTELPHPLAIALDRSISAEADDQVFLESLPRRALKAPTKTPIEKVIEVTRERYAAYRERIATLNEELKARLVISTFKSPYSTGGKTSKKKISLSEISKLEKKVTNLIGASLKNDAAAMSTMERYFFEAKLFVKSAGKDVEKLAFVWTRFKQIGELARTFSDYEKRSSNEFEGLGSYIKTLNLFFADSNKSIGFSDLDGSLSFQNVHDGAPFGEFQSVERLSSGERQVLTLLTFLAFVSGPDRVFIVDEPELSLHPKWQHGFLDAMLAQSPKNTQIILATHSPEIVAKHRDRCIVLSQK